MSIRGSNGRWDLNKRPVVWEFDAQLECGHCGKAERFVFEARPTEGAALEGQYPGTWRHLGIVGGHDDPLRPDTIVCGIVCALSAADKYVKSLYLP